MADRIQIRRDTAADWLLNDPILAQGELGLELVTNGLKVGDAVTAWSALPYLFSGSMVRPIKVVSADFTSATEYDNALIVGQDLGIFLNGIGRYLEDSEWSATATGIKILIAGFDATVDSHTFFISIL